jgi:hypothetical protein
VLETRIAKEKEKLVKSFLSIAGLAALATATAMSQSSGNFSATGFNPACQINQNDGTFTGNCVVNGVTQFSNKCDMMSANISMSPGSGNTLLIRPSLVTGLFTDTNLQSNNTKSTGITTATADIGIQVCVTVDGSGAGILPNSCVIYDQRFQQLSTNLFSQISTCALTTPPPCCATNSCAAGTACTVCFLDLTQSTESAHSFDFVVPQTAMADGKAHTVKATWNVFGATSATGGTVGACVGSGMITLTQTKVFNNSGGLGNITFN